MIGDEGSGIANLLDPEKLRQTKRVHRAQDAITKLAAFTATSTITREHAIQIMESVANLLGALLDQQQPATSVGEDGTGVSLEIELTHPATDAVRQVATALLEVQHGVVHPIFKPPPGLGVGNVATANERELARTAVTLVRALRQHRKLTVDQACHAVADALAHEGIQGRGQCITPKTLKGWVKGRRPGASR